MGEKLRVAVTGANGFIGQALVRRLLADETALGAPVASLTLLDIRFDRVDWPGQVAAIEGRVDDPALLRLALEEGMDVVFHLASLPGGIAEEHYFAGKRANLDATLDLFDLLSRQSRPPVVVFSSSVAVYGPVSDPVGPSTPLRPVLSYGAHKAACELMLQDLSRRGSLDGRALRLPGIVARPWGPSGLRSAFMSDLLWAAKEGAEFICPVSPEATAWWMSAKCCVDNLLQAARLDRGRLGRERVWTPPVLHLSISAIVEACAKLFGEEVRSRIRFRPDKELEAVFGSFPALMAREAEELGFKSDGTAEQLVLRAVGERNI